jgi:very-long-chain enoyl-CoA reductase
MAIKLVVKSRTGRDVLPDGILLPSNVRPKPRCFERAIWLCKLPSRFYTTCNNVQATVDELKARFAELKPRYYASRQRFTLPPRDGQRSGDLLVSGKKLSDYGLEDGSMLFFKDLGAQVREAERSERSCRLPTTCASCHDGPVVSTSPACPTTACSH